MPVNKIHKMAVAERRRQVAELYIQGWTQVAIAEEVGVKQPTICDDLKKIRQHWLESAVRDFDAARELELQKLDRIEREAWAAWERSQKPAQSAQINDETHQRRTRRHVRHQYGDPRFLEQVNKCIASRRALLGLDAPVRTETVIDGCSLEDRRDRVLTVVAALCHRRGAEAVGDGPGGDEPGGLRALGQ